MTDKPMIEDECIENYVNHLPVTTIPYRKEQVISVLYALGGIIKMRMDYKDQGYNLIQELIRLVEDNNKDEEIPEGVVGSGTNIAVSFGG